MGRVHPVGWVSNPMSGSGDPRGDVGGAVFAAKA